MTAFNLQRRQMLSRVFTGTLGAAIATPALAQDMGDNGMAIPSFFFSGSERRAREACENRLPECRPKVRAQMSFERDVSLFLPWLGLGLAVLALLFYARKNERAKDAKRKLAQRHHVPGAFKTMGDTPTAGRSEPTEADDRFG